VIKGILRADYSKHFRKPVDIHRYKCYDYYDKIKYPMDISTIIVLNYIYLVIFLEKTKR